MFKKVLKAVGVIVVVAGMIFATFAHQWLLTVWLPGRWPRKTGTTMTINYLSEIHMLPSALLFDVQEPSSIARAGRLEAERQRIGHLESVLVFSFIGLAVLMWWALQTVLPGHGFIWGVLVLLVLFVFFQKPYRRLRALHDLYSELQHTEIMRATELSDQHRSLEKYRLAVCEARKLVRGDLKAMEAFAMANGLL